MRDGGTYHGFDRWAGNSTEARGGDAGRVDWKTQAANKRLSYKTDTTIGIQDGVGGGSRAVEVRYGDLCGGEKYMEWGRGGLDTGNERCRVESLLSRTQDRGRNAHWID